MWKKLGETVLRNRFVLLGLLLISTAFMAWQASKVQLSYEFSRAIPTDHPKYIAYQEFKKRFGEDGNLMVIGIQTKIFSRSRFLTIMFGCMRI
jgi:predicted RND superfamily exporter protein